MEPMKVLVACEESQRVCIEFRKRGHEAYSCDLQDCSGGHPEWHLKMDVFKAIEGNHWDMMIGFPPCTYLTNAGIGWFNESKYGQKAIDRNVKRKAAASFFMMLYYQPIKYICLENPVGWMNKNFMKPSQIVHPYYFGDPHVKPTCLWLRGLSPLVYDKDNVVKPDPLKIAIRKPGGVNPAGSIKKQYFIQGGPKNPKERSKTFPGIAKAMAEQWSPDLGYLNEETFLR